MRIDVRTGQGPFDEQTRAYAEFRIFSALARFGRRIDAATMVLTRLSDGAGWITCGVSIAFAGGGRLRVRSRGGHAYDAINRAVDRVSDLLRDDHPPAAAPEPGLSIRQETTS